MKIGICVRVEDVLPVRDGQSNGERLMAAGFDYVELPLAAVSQLTEVEFDALLRGMEAVKCEACNVFLPAAVKIVGPYVDTVSFKSYLDHAVKRAAALGAEIIVLGSAGARNIPDGFPAEKAWEQLVDAFRIVSEAIKPYGITVVVEPLNAGESNIINTLPEGYAMVKAVERDNIRLLADYYHMALEKEPLSHVTDCGDMLRHVHFAEPDGRVFPHEPKEEYTAFFRSLHDAGYQDQGRVSFECGSRAPGLALPDEAAAALAVLRKVIAD